MVRKLLSGTPAHAKEEHPRTAEAYEPEHKTAFDLGTATHAILLRDREHFEVVDSDSWRGEAGKAREAAWEAGRTPLLRHQYEEARRRAQACMDHLADHSASDAFRPDLGTSELTIVWREGEVWCRCRPDWLPRVRREGMVVYDYKTTAVPATAEHWGARTARELNVIVQAAWYRRGTRAHFGVRDVGFRFVVQELHAPWLLNVFEADPEAMDAEDARIDRAVALWGRCLSTGIWPGYPPQILPLGRREEPEWRAEMIGQREAGIDHMMTEAALRAHAPLEDA
jgi:hypothetical protein